MGDSEGGLPPNGLHHKQAAAFRDSFIKSRSIDEARWRKAEQRTEELIKRIRGTPSSEARRKDVADYVQYLIQKCFDCQVNTFGSVPLKTYLPDGDIDLTIVSKDPRLKETWVSSVRSALEKAERNQDGKFRVTEVQFINAEVQLIKCHVENIVVDISFNQFGGLCTLCFLEEVDRVIGNDHFFKRSIILVKAWCYYESAILGAHHGLISTYALETLVLYIFHVFHNSLRGPLEVLLRFLEFFSKFDWYKYAVSVWGPVPLSSLPEMIAEAPRKDSGELLLSKDFLEACLEDYAIFLTGPDSSQTRAFAPKHLNIVDPLRAANNLGRSVSQTSFNRITSVLGHSAEKLLKILTDTSKDIDEYFEDRTAGFFRRTNDRLDKFEKRSDAAAANRTSQYATIGYEGLHYQNYHQNGWLIRQVVDSAGHSHLSETNNVDGKLRNNLEGSILESDQRSRQQSSTPSTQLGGSHSDPLLPYAISNRDMDTSVETNFDSIRALVSTSERPSSESPKGSSNSIHSTETEVSRPNGWAGEPPSYVATNGFLDGQAYATQQRGQESASRVSILPHRQIPVTIPHQGQLPMHLATSMAVGPYFAVQLPVRGPPVPPLPPGYFHRPPPLPQHHLPTTQEIPNAAAGRPAASSFPVQQREDQGFERQQRAWQQMEQMQQSNGHIYEDIGGDVGNPTTASGKLSTQVGSEAGTRAIKNSKSGKDKGASSKNRMISNETAVDVRIGTPVVESSGHQPIQLMANETSFQMRQGHPQRVSVTGGPAVKGANSSLATKQGPTESAPLPPAYFTPGNLYPFQSMPRVYAVSSSLREQAVIGLDAFGAMHFSKPSGSYSDSSFAGQGDASRLRLSHQQALPGVGERLRAAGVATSCISSSEAATTDAQASDGVDSNFGVGDLLSSDLNSHVRNLHYALWCQDNTVPVPIAYIPQYMAATPKNHQEYRAWKGPGRPLAANANVYSNVMNYGHGIVQGTPSTSMQMVGSFPHSFAGPGGNNTEDLPNAYGGTGLYIPNPKPAYVGDRHSSVNGRNQHAGYSQERGERSDREGHQLNGPRLRARGQNK